MMRAYFSDGSEPTMLLSNTRRWLDRAMIAVTCWVIIAWIYFQVTG